MSPDEEGLNKHLDVHPEDQMVRSMLADLLDDLGRTRLAGYLRWMVRENKYPEYWLGQPPYDWYWWGGADEPYLHAVVPKHLIKGMNKVNQIWKFTTRTEAENCLFRALRWHEENPTGEQP